ncbi:MAG: GAF domain-containing protein [Arcobacteraceae bacterium]|nr:GAF domain-containing protein [Arcobacteraceae bacterium]
MAKLDKDLMERLMNLNLKITQEKDFVKKITIISDAIRDIIKADRCSIFVHDKNSKSFWTVHADGISYLELPDDRGIISKAYNTRKTLIDNNVEANPSAVKSVDLKYKTKSIISMPVFGFNDECIGIVQLLNKNSDEGFSDTDQKILLFLVKHFTTFIQLIVQEN